MVYSKFYPELHEVSAPKVEIHLDGDILYEFRPYLLALIAVVTSLAMLLLFL